LEEDEVFSNYKNRLSNPIDYSDMS